MTTRTAASRLLLTACLAALAVLLAPSAVAASCADPGPDGPSGPVVLVGTVEERRGSHTAFAVRVVRAGPDLAPRVWLRTAEELSGVWPFTVIAGSSSSADADLVVGETYLVAASEDFSTSVCRVVELEPSAASGPDEARPPTARGSTGADPPASTLQRVLVTGWALLALGALLALVLRRRRRRRATA